MRKLDNLKNWYSLQDAAKRLTITLGEEVLVKDILQMAVEGHLTLSWYMRHVPSQPVAPYTRICNWDKAMIQFSEFLGNPYDTKPNVLHVMPSLEILSDEVEYLDGPHTLDLEICPAMKDWVVSLVHNTGGKLIALDGYFVRDIHGSLWRIMERFTKEELAAKEKAAKTPLPPPYPGHSKSFNHRDYFYPSDGDLKREELGFTKADIEKFEALATKKPIHAEGKPLKTRERETALKLIVGMAAAWYGYDPRTSKSSTVTEIVNDLAGKGIVLSDDTVRRWLTEAAEYLPQNEEA